MSHHTHPIKAGLAYFFIVILFSPVSRFFHLRLGATWPRGWQMRQTLISLGSEEEKRLQLRSVGEPWKA